MVLIQMLLPAAVPRNEERAPLIRQTRQELLQRFDGVTAYLRSPAKGLWTSPDGDTAQDDVVMVEVVTEAFDRAWWRGYAHTLARRFGQQTVHVRALGIDLVDDEANGH